MYRCTLTYKKTKSGKADNPSSISLSTECSVCECVSVTKNGGNGYIMPLASLTTGSKNEFCGQNCCLGKTFESMAIAEVDIYWCTSALDMEYALWGGNHRMCIANACSLGN